MKKISWEIIIAGILLLFVAIFITSRNEDDAQNYGQEEERLANAVSASQEAETVISSQRAHVINIEEIAKTEDLQELSELNSLEGLKRLKSLAGLLPDSLKNNIITELNTALSELENDSFSINVDFEDNLVLVQKEYNTEEGEWASLTPGVFVYTKDFDTSKLKDISVELTSGSVILIGSDDLKGSITVKASGEIVARELLEEVLSVSIDNKDSNAEIRVRNTKKDSSNIQLQTTIIIPSSLNINSLVETGHIEATNFKGDLELKTLGGHITLRDINGNLTAFTEGGHISLSNSIGDASLKSLGGHLTVNGFDGDLEMRTSGGNVTAAKLAGSVNAFSSGGNINLQLNNVTGAVQARNGAGQISLSLPMGINADLNASGTKVEVTSGLSFKGEKRKNQIIGQLGKGGYPITLKTGYGTVLVKKNE